MNNMAYSDMSYSSDQRPAISRMNDIKAIKTSALYYLARREYSRLELFRKLSVKYGSSDNIQYVLDELKDQGYQSDDRFTEMFIRTKVRAGDGPFKIKIALREKGICESTALSAFDKQSIDWLEVAKQVAQKRFGSKVHSIDTNSEADIDAEADIEETEIILSNEEQLVQLAKKIRYLKNKGFYQEHIDQVIGR